MAYQRWNPWRDLAELQEGIIRTLEENLPFTEGKREEGEWTPRVDVVEKEKEVVFYFDLPGMDQKEIDITVSEDRLVISGERKSSDAQGSFLRKERIFGPFKRSFVVRIPIDVERVVATYKNGVLEVHLPKFEEVKTKKVLVQEG